MTAQTTTGRRQTSSCRVEGVCLMATPKAILVLRHEDNRKVWVPKSVIVYGDDDPVINDDVEIEVERWFYEREFDE